MKKSVLLFDLHCPFQDNGLVGSILKFIKALKLNKGDEVILGGDFIDFYSISKFDKSNNRIVDGLQDERKVAVEVLKNIRKAAGKARIIFIKGNHEVRLEKYLSREANALSGLPELQLGNFLSFDKYNVEVRNYVYNVNNNFIVKHGTAFGKYPSRSELDKELINGASGHAHRTDMSYKRGYNKNMRWYSFGHLADKAVIDEVCKFSEALRWCQSFGLLVGDDDSWDIEVMHCDNNKFYSKYLRKWFGG